MNHKLLNISLVLFLFFTFSTGQESSAQAQEIVSSPLPFTSLTFDIEGPKRPVLSLEPILIKLKLTNPNNAPALGYDEIDFDLPINVSVRKSDKTSKVWISALQPMSKFIRFTHSLIGPHQSVVGKELVTIGLERYFPESGSYEIQATLANSDGTKVIESNLIQVMIKAPTSANLAAFNLIREGSFQEFIFSGLDFNKTKNTLESVSSLPNTPYARYASFVLAENYFYGKNYSRALFHLLKLENDADFAYAEKVKNYLDEIRRINALPKLQ